jgi:hypothetical protein
MKSPFGRRPPANEPLSGAQSVGAAIGVAAVPVITSLNPNQGPTSGGNTVTITGTSLTGATVVKFGTTAATFTFVADTQINAVAPAHAAGSVQVTVTTSGGVSAGVTYTYLPAPSITSLSPSQGPTSGGNTVTLTGANFGGVTLVRFDGVPAVFTFVSGTQINAVAPTHGAGPAQITVTTPGGTSSAATYFYVAVPTTAGLNPDKGPAAGGNLVTITGGGLLGASAVQFGGSNATFTIVSDSQLDAVAPVHSAGPVLITVTTPGGTSPGIYYLYVAAPVANVLTPNVGPTLGGNTVTITGTGLTFIGAVRFDTTLASFTVFSDTQATAIAPAHAAGAIQVTVTTPGGVSGGAAYTYLVPPVVT